MPSFSLVIEYLTGYAVGTDPANVSSLNGRLTRPASSWRWPLHILSPIRQTHHNATLSNGSPRFRRQT